MSVSFALRWAQFCTQVLTQANHETFKAVHSTTDNKVRTNKIITLVTLLGTTARICGEVIAQQARDEALTVAPTNKADDYMQSTKHAQLVTDISSKLRLKFVQSSCLLNYVDMMWYCLSPDAHISLWLKREVMIATAATAKLAQPTTIKLLNVLTDRTIRNTSWQCSCFALLLLVRIVLLTWFSTLFE